ncbi:hypothetical protein JD508_18735 [Aeromonas jandaei]|uniref:P-loop NTPase fold protein n=1 Tax=Aeromonas jandaei TaxID=650 RepID=UPI00191DBD29|nr:P-loop NTPase fold protein [Aeromonas jandaei]MBL0612266.1 hypothetical protein [Aeromonas jandaei]
MSLAKTKEQLIYCLQQSSNKVVALSGKWGAGKTHLWSQVKNSSNDPGVKDSLYVSLFGLSSVDQVKRKLIESVVPIAASHETFFSGVKNLFKAGVTAASAHYKALAAINDINVLMMAPLVLKDKIIVIDDIERKHARLGIDEVLGFIDEYSQQHSSRFILVLNDDQLSIKDDQRKIWELFREKVIDCEIKLSTSPEDAFSIGIESKPSRYAESIRDAVIKCSLTNIRVIVKVISIVNQILADRVLDEEILARTVPSIVLLSAIHFRGIDNGPDFQFILQSASFDWDLWLKEVEGKELTAEEIQNETWWQFLKGVGFTGCDEFEMHLIEYLESGLFDADKINHIISKYSNDIQLVIARNNANNFLKNFNWNYRVDNYTLLDDAKKLEPLVGYVDSHITSQIYNCLTSIPGGDVVGCNLVKAWIDHYNTTEKSIERYNPLPTGLHPEIQAALAKKHQLIQSSTTVYDACKYIADNRSWDSLHENALRSSTPNDFVVTIKSIENIDDLTRFMRRMMAFRIEHLTYEQYFGKAAENFMVACRELINDADNPRLAVVINNFFKDSSLKYELNEDDKNNIVVISE